MEEVQEDAAGSKHGLLDQIQRQEVIIYKMEIFIKFISVAFIVIVMTVIAIVVCK